MNGTIGRNNFKQGRRKERRRIGLKFLGMLRKKIIWREGWGTMAAA